VLAVVIIATLFFFLVPVVPIRGPACLGGASCESVHSSARASVTYAYFGIGEVHVTVSSGGNTTNTNCWMAARSQDTVCGMLTM
jgi:hypothetical protein